METPKISYCVSTGSFLQPVFDLFHSRTMLPDGVKSKSWEDRMQKAQKEKAIKKLQAELSEEKRAEKERSVAARTTA